MTKRLLTTAEKLTRIRKIVIESESLSIQAVVSDFEFIKRYFMSHKQIVIDDCIKAIDDVLSKDSNRKKLNQTYGNMPIFLDTIMRVEFSEAEKEHEILESLVLLHSFYRIKVLSKPREIEINEYVRLQELFSNQKQSRWFRGHSDSNWELVPSLFRDIKEKQINFDYVRMLDDLQQKKIIEKLEIVFGSGEFDYDKLAYTQHSLGYGPMLDFTKSSQIACSFALSNMENIAHFFHKKFCIYELDIGGIELLKTKEEIGTALSSLNIVVFSGKPYIETILKTQLWQDLLDGSTESEVFLLDYQTNDRMRYQQGAFLLFNNVIIVGGRMIMSFRKQESLSQRMNKYLISEDLRHSFYTAFLDQYPQYRIRFLMDPYSFFKE